MYHLGEWELVQILIRSSFFFFIEVALRESALIIHWVVNFLLKFPLSKYKYKLFSKIICMIYLLYLSYLCDWQPSIDKNNQVFSIFKKRRNKHSSILKPKETKLQEKYLLASHLHFLWFYKSHNNILRIYINEKFCHKYWLLWKNWHNFLILLAYF